MKRRSFVALATLPFLTPLASAETHSSFIVHEAPKPFPAIPFTDGEGRQLTLSEFHGKIVLLNVWATWCGPCRTEMPTLDRLQAKLGGSDFQVVALSIDRKGPDAVRKFFAEIGIQHLSLFIDRSGTAVQTLGAFGLPATLLLDRQGQEIGRLVGPAEWDAPEMIALLENAIAGRAGASSSPHQKENTQ